MSGPYSSFVKVLSNDTKAFITEDAQTSFPGFLIFISTHRQISVVSFRLFNFISLARTSC